MTSSTRSDFQSAAKEFKDNANDMKDSLRQSANQAGRQVRQFIDSASDQLGDVGDNVKSTIRHRPLQASLIALGCGFILGALLRR